MFKAIFLALAVTSLAWKVMNGVAPDPRDPARLTAALDGLLRAQGYRVEGGSGMAEPWIAADRDGCRMVIAEIRPQGWNAAIIAKMRQPESELVYVFQGAFFSSLPTWRATALYQATRIARQVGLPLPWFPLLAVITNPRCAASEFPWADVGALR